MKTKATSIFVTIAMMFATQTANAQRILTYDEYMKNVREKNIIKKNMKIIALK